MTKDEFHELIMGAVLIAAGYALYVHFNKSKTPATSATVNGIVVPNVTPQQVTAQQTATQTATQNFKAKAIDTASNLLSGAVNDWISGSSTDTVDMTA